LKHIQVLFPAKQSAMFINTRVPSLGLCHRKEINCITPLPAHVYNDYLHPPRNR